MTTDYGVKTNVAVVTVANGKLYNLNVQFGQVRRTLPRWWAPGP